MPRLGSAIHPHRRNCGFFFNAGFLTITLTLTSFYGSSCADNGEGALNTPETRRADIDERNRPRCSRAQEQRSQKFAQHSRALAEWDRHIMRNRTTLLTLEAEFGRVKAANVINPPKPNLNPT
eukprot:1180264-Prorocentrum_minimum.AAC.3